MATALKLAIAYLGWNFAVRIVFLTLITYFMSHSGAQFGEISATANTNQILISGAAAIGFALILLQLNPIAIVSRSEIITEHLVESEFYPAFLKGAAFGFLFVFIGISAGYYTYVGFFVQNQAPSLTLLALTFRGLAIISMIYIDEFIFRGRFLHFLKDQASPLQSLLLCVLFYALSKALSFHLGLSHIVSLLVIGANFSLRAYLGLNFASGAGFLSGLLVITHCVFSLPIFGNETHGAILLQYNLRSEMDHPVLRYLSGGLGGPLSSVGIQILLFADLAKNLIKNKKTFLPMITRGIK